MTPPASNPNPRGSLKSLAVVVLLVLGGTQALSWWQERQSANEIKAHLGQQRITLYTTVTCYYCTKAKAWLARHDIPWDECDVEVDEGCKRTFEAQGAPGTPLVRVNSHWHLGFDPAWVAKALQLRPAAQPSPSTAKSPRP